MTQANSQPVDNIDLDEVERDVMEEWSRYSQRPNAHLISRATEYPVLLKLFEERRRLYEAADHLARELYDL